MKDAITEVLKYFVIPEELDELVDKIVAEVEKHYDSVEEELQEGPKRPPRKQSKRAIISYPDLQGNSGTIKAKPLKHGELQQDAHKDVVIGKPKPDEHRP